MGHDENILKLRKRVLDAVNAGILDGKIKDFYEATLLQILNECERQRQTCCTQAEALRKQASVAEGQAASYSAMGSIIYNVLNAYVVHQERMLQEEASLVAEQQEKQELINKLKAESKLEVDVNVEVDKKEETREERKERALKRRL